MKKHIKIKGTLIPPEEVCENGIYFTARVKVEIIEQTHAGRDFGPSIEPHVTKRWGPIAFGGGEYKLFSEDNSGAIGIYEAHSTCREKYWFVLGDKKESFEPTFLLSLVHWEELKRLVKEYNEYYA